MLIKLVDYPDRSICTALINICIVINISPNSKSLFLICTTINWMLNKSAEIHYDQN